MTPTPAEAASYLSRREHATPAALFPSDRAAASRPGLYAWWVDADGRRFLESSLGEDLPDLVYAGQAGATSTRSAKLSTATLASRIVSNHLRGTAYGSTFRKTISALLLQPLGLRVEKPDHLTRGDNLRVSEWIRAHMSVAVFPYDEPSTLKAFEAAVLAILDPPLNLDGMPRTPIRRRVSELRQRVARPPVV